MEFAENVALAPYTTFRIGGPARWFAEASTEADIASGVAFATERGLPLFVLGGGSNLLVSDAGFPGLVLHIALRGIAADESRGFFAAAAGEEWDGLVAQTVAADCAGLECLSGIPGSVGGTPVQNVGAYGQEVSQTISAVRVFDRQRREFTTLGNSECEFSYRRSMFNSTARGHDRDRYIVCQVEYQLKPHGSPTLAYQDLKCHFQGCSPQLFEVREAVRSIRASKGMLILPGAADSLSAGSFFKNPIVPLSTLWRIAGVLQMEKDDIPRYRAGDGAVKLPAAWLLEQAGFHKGYSLGKAGISSRHTLALINRGGAKAEDILALRDGIVDTVESKFGVHLDPEPVWVS